MIYNINYPNNDTPKMRKWNFLEQLKDYNNTTTNKKSLKSLQEENTKEKHYLWNIQEWESVFWLLLKKKVRVDPNKITYIDTNNSKNYTSSNIPIWSKVEYSLSPKWLIIYITKVNKDLNWTKSKSTNSNDKEKNNPDTIISTLGTLERWKSILWLLNDKNITWINPQNIIFKNTSNFNEDYNATNIPIWSKLEYSKNLDWNITIYITPPIIVAKEKFEKKEDLIETIKKEAKTYPKIDYKIILAMIWVESFFWQDNSNNTFLWYMQLDKNTSTEVFKKWLIDEKIAKEATKWDWFNEANIITWIRYLKLLLEKFKWYKNQEELALVSYNRGPYTIERIIAELWLNENNASLEKISPHLSKIWQKYVKKIYEYANKMYWLER